MQHVIKTQAGDHEKFSKNAFDSQLGKVIPFNFRETDDGPVIATIGEACLVKVDILEEGTVAELTFDVPYADLPKITGSMSFSFKDK